MKSFLRRPAPWALVDGATVALSYYAAFLFRFLANPTPDLPGFLTPLNALVVPICLVYVVCNHLWRLDRRAWHYASGQEVTAIAAPAALATLLTAAMDVAAGVETNRPLPVSVILLGGFFSFTGFVALRYRSRVLSGLRWRWSALQGERPARRTRTLVYGAGETGQLLARRLLQEEDGQRYQLVGFIDDARDKRGLRIHGIEVLGGRGDLSEAVRSKQVDLIILAMSRVGGGDLREIVALCQETPTQIRTVPNFFELMDAPSPSPLLREVGVEDLLGRKPVTMDRAACARLLAGKAVLVTGASGSIGSELCRQIAGFDPEVLVALDNNETGVYDLEVELRARFPKLRLAAEVGDVTDGVRMRRAFEAHRPQVVYHAAAYKHVPLMEQHPTEAVRVNVGGTRVILECARCFGTEQFILVSTDKAVNPLNVMGASKRVAELLVLAGKFPYSVVRFGNVLGSRGSVVPTFARQIELGGPVTVTHTEATRYFMELSEAVSLMLQAGALAKGGDTFMLEMGEQIRVDDLARRMIRLRGLRPDVDLAIVYTGLRPGEKLREELNLATEGWERTSHPEIYHFAGNGRHDAATLYRAVAELERLAAAGDEEGAREAVLRLGQS